MCKEPSPPFRIVTKGPFELKAEALRAALNLAHGLKNPADDGFFRGVLQSVGLMNFQIFLRQLALRASN